MSKVINISDYRKDESEDPVLKRIIDIIVERLRSSDLTHKGVGLSDPEETKIIRVNDDGNDFDAALNEAVNDGSAIRNDILAHLMLFNDALEGHHIQATIELLTIMERFISDRSRFWKMLASEEQTEAGCIRCTIKADDGHSVHLELTFYNQ